jgi:SAM-dependent methyltransferase
LSSKKPRRKLDASYDDEIARINRETFAREKQEGKEWTIPWLDLDVSAFREYREGQRTELPTPFFDDPALRLMMEKTAGMEVLCLAGGGGQQSAVYSLLGAKVTVVDLTPEQLEGDKAAADHYGYPVTLHQGDMRDLSFLPSTHFDRVHQPISTLYIPDLDELYAGVARILKPGGLYFSDYTFPMLDIADKREWDGKGYPVLITEPYRRGALYEKEDEKISLSEGKFYGEFHHLLSDIVNGHIRRGLELRGLWENPRPDGIVDLGRLEPGSKEHRDRYIPFGITVVAKRKI